MNLIARITTTTTAEMLRTALLKLGAFGVEPSVPVNVAGEDPADNRRARAAGSGAAEAQWRRGWIRARRCGRSPRPLDQRGRREQLTARMRAVFGQTFVVLPRFTFDAAGATELASALAAEHRRAGRRSAGGATPGSRGASRVRDGVARLSACLQRAEVLGAGARLNLSVAQLPFVTGERWVGLPPAAGARDAAEQAVARAAHHRHDQPHAGA